MNAFVRTSGILVPLFSLRSRSDFGVGDFGALESLFRWMREADQQVLMLLPLLPTAPGDSSPYSTRSAFGLNPLFIDVLSLPGGVVLEPEERERLEAVRSASTVQYAEVFELKNRVLERAFARFEAEWARGGPERAPFEQFLEAESRWLADFALYSALSEAHQQRPFWEWDAPVAQRVPEALAAERTRLERRVRYFSWLQWVAHLQWERVRVHARAAGVLLCGDEPFIISQDSSDVWAHPHLLRRDARLGVPPDDFSADGQDWGLPYFDFEAMDRENDAWLRYRAEKAASYYDLRRIDHAIGYFRQYIRDEHTPRGRFIPPHEPEQRARGEKNFRLLSAGAGVIGEDLGVIPDFAREVLVQVGVPGYQVMRWSRRDGVYAHPHHYPARSLVTTGTHDTETLVEFWETAQPWEKGAMCHVFPELQGFDANSPWSEDLQNAMLRAALEASSELCILPWQDVFGERVRVNTPATVGAHNWSYRMAWKVEELLTLDTPVRRAAWLRRHTLQSRRSQRAL